MLNMNQHEVERNLLAFNLEYTSLLLPGSVPYFKSDNGLWRDYGVNLQRHIQIIDNLRCIERTISLLKQDDINSVSLLRPHLNSGIFTVAIRGNQQYINSSRIRILQSYNHVSFKRINLTEAEFSKLENDGDEFLNALTRIGEKEKVEIIIDNVDTDFKSLRTPCENYAIYVLGNQDNTTVAETKVRIIVDNLLSGFFVDSLEVELSLIPILGGASLLNFNQIVKQLNSNIYLPDILPHLFNSTTLTSTNDLKIWFTAKEVYEILQTKKMLSDMIQRLRNENNSLVKKEICITKVKLDLITQFEQAKLLELMFKDGTFIQLPYLGESDNYNVTIQAQSTESLEDTIHEFTLLCSKYYTITMSFADLYNPDLECYLIDLTQLSKSNIITYNKFGIQIDALSQDVKLTLANMNSNLYFWKNLMDDFALKVRIELNNSQKDFISGKKNGKVIKILSQLNNLCELKFSPYNEYNFYIDLKLYKTSNGVISNLVKGIELLELELPAELKFNIPEVFHKSIIGNGGSIIQSIMKKYNVFIKFSTNRIKEDTIFYSFRRRSNVLIKCPHKNGKNIGFVKQEIDHLVTHCCLKNKPVANGNTVYNTTTFELWKSHYLLLINKNYNLRFVNDLEHDLNTYITFPASIEDFGPENKLMIEIKGADLKSKQCAQSLTKLLPRNYAFRLTYCPAKFGALISHGCREFNERVVVPFRLVLGVELTLQTTSASFHEVILSCFTDSSMDIAINDLTLYLREKSFLILDKSEMEVDYICDFIAANQASHGMGPSLGPGKGPNLGPNLGHNLGQSGPKLKPITNRMNLGTANKMSVPLLAKNVPTTTKSTAAKTMATSSEQKRL